jgi:hypothetical protein
MALSRPNLGSKRCPQTRSGAGVNRPLSTGVATAMVTIPAQDSGEQARSGKGGGVMSHIVRDHPISMHHPPKAQHKRHLPSFWRHFLQMLLAMAVGMIATGAIFLSVVGLKTWDQVLLQYPTQALLAMAAGMTIPMAAWMLFRGMGRRNTAEMAAAMVLPVIPFLCLVWFHVTKSAQCGAYCVLTIVAMLGLMFYRRGQYSAQGPATATHTAPGTGM